MALATLRVMSLIEFRLIFCYQKGFRRKRKLEEGEEELEEEETTN